MSHYGEPRGANKRAWRGRAGRYVLRTPHEASPALRNSQHHEALQAGVNPQSQVLSKVARRTASSFPAARRATCTQP